MGEFKKLTVELDEAAADDVARAVAQGDYATEEQVVIQAIEGWRRDRDADVERLRLAFASGLASGEPIEGNFDAEDVKRRGRERLAARRV